MAKAGRPFLNASRRRVETLDGTANKTMSTVTGDSNPQGGSAGTSIESGETYLITGDNDAERTITLPPASKGAWVKIVFGVEQTGNDWIIATQDGEPLNGQLFWFDVNTEDKSNNIVDTAANLNGSTDEKITIGNDIKSGTMLTFMSDGSEWYSLENQVIGSDEITVGAV